MEPQPKIVCLTNGMFMENCYLIGSPEASEAALIDPGEEADLFLRRLEHEGLELKQIWLTHGHVDHVDGVQRVARETKEDRLDVAEPSVEAAPAAPIVPEATTDKAPEAPSVEQSEAIVTPSDVRVGTPVNIVTADDKTVITPESTVIREIVDDPEHGTYVFVEGTETGFPIEQIQPIETSPQETALRNVLQGISDEISDAEIRQIAAGDRTHRCV